MAISDDKKNIKNPSEFDETRALFAYLRREKIMAIHVPNGAHREKRTAALLKLSGVTAGVPDFLVITPCPRQTRYRNVWIELKTRTGGRLSTAQKQLISHLEAFGDCVIVARGAKEAVEKLREVGYEL